MLGHFGFPFFAGFEYQACVRSGTISRAEKSWLAQTSEFFVNLPQAILARDSIKA
jgi:hypothetical protein